MKTSILAFLLSLAAASAFGQTADQKAPATPPAQNAPAAAAVTPLANPPANPQATPATAQTAAPAPFPSSGYLSYAFKDLGAPQGLRLVEGSAEGGITYMVRRDEVITAARLRLMLENSAGFPPDTKLEVTVNGDSVGTVDVGADRHSATPVDLPVDPILLGDYNSVSFKLLGVPLASCTVNDTGPWMSISPRSEMDFTAGRLPLANDLAVLPLPFFDDRDPHALETSFIYSRAPGPAELEASGIVASWLGGMAGYRGVHLPAVFGSVPAGNAVVFATGKDSIPGLTLPQAAGPTLAMVPNPTDPNGKLLLVLGRNADDLKIAARGLALGHGAFKAGAVSAVASVAVPERKPYDAPGWIADTHTVKFSELATTDQLRSRGIRPEPIVIDFRSAPDYFNWIDATIPMKLRFHVNPEQIVDLGRSRLDVSLNNTPFRSVPLSETGTLINPGGARHDGTVDIPPFLLTGRNRLSFYFDLQPSPQCDATKASTLAEEIDPNSTIDLSQSPHYAPMPNLSFFANAGFPFTRDADLSHTAVVMPDQITSDDTEAFLETMAMFGEATGYPTLNAEVVRSGDVNSVANRDLVLIGSFTHQPLLGAWTARTGLGVNNGQIHAMERSWWERIQLAFDWRNRRSHIGEVNDWLQAQQGGEGALIGFRSPLNDDRSVVAVAGTTSQDVAQTARLLQTNDRVVKVQDDLVLIRPNDVQSFRLSRRYDVGTLARWTWLRWNLSDQPIVIAILLFAACAAMGAVAFVVLGIKARRRLQGANR
ncbi:MAG: cellulose biosynthesis cyclic di-GMP-binding regulatory protein BcsB, partial [Stellaceae bacterium]